MVEGWRSKAGAEFDGLAEFVDGFGSVRELAFPRVAELFATRKNVALGIVEILVNARALNLVAGAAAGDQVGSILFPFVSPGENKVNRQDKGVFEAGFSVQAAIAATKMVAFEDFPGFGPSDRFVHNGQSDEVERHGTPPVSG